MRDTDPDPKVEICSNQGQTHMVKIRKNKDDWGSLKKEFYRNGVIFFLKTRPKMIGLLRIRIKIIFSHCLNLAQRYFSSFNQ